MSSQHAPCLWTSVMAASYVTGDARGTLGGLEGDVLHGEFVALRPQGVPRLLILDLQYNTFIQ